MLATSINLLIKSTVSLLVEVKDPYDCMFLPSDEFLIELIHFDCLAWISSGTECIASEDGSKERRSKALMRNSEERYLISSNLLYKRS